uniref:RNA-directed DNA polymerase n=1 Tax=Photinus pyralis TaxID=7054 RepID=A0A1Y1JVH7_PHOPY
MWNHWGYYSFMYILFGKRTTKRSLGCREVSEVPTTKFLKSSSKPKLDFLLQHVNNDLRPYVKLTILNLPLIGLLDSGASRSFINQDLCFKLQQLNLKFVEQLTSCTVANSVDAQSIGYIIAPLTLKDRTVILNLLVMPSLTTDLILGIDFWDRMGIIPNVSDDCWHFVATTPTTVPSLAIIDQPHLTAEQQKSLAILLDQKFEAMGTQLGVTTVGKHEIRLVEGATPLKQRYYPVNPIKQKIINTCIDEMLRDHVIEPSNSPWASPVCLIPKKDNTYRFCVDYRKLNSLTVKDSFPLPYISTILDQLRDARYLSSLDIKAAYWQVEVTESSRPYTAFTVPGRGLFQFRRMPFGLTNAPATFQRIIDTVLGPELQPNVLVYLDDVIIVSQDFDSHLRILQTVFDKLRAAGFILNKDKCHFCRSELKYLGYVVDAHGLHPDPDKVKAILNITSPTNLQEVRRFLGTCSWYRRFIPEFSTIVSPLTRLLKKDVKFDWTSECEEAFVQLKQLLATAPILHCPDFTKSFILQTDASAYGLGAVLTQTFPDGERVICYLSRSLSHAERNYSTTERECLAVIWGVEQLRHYLEGVSFTVVTDHHSLLWLHSLKDPQGRLARWALRLQPYTFTLVHRKGKDNVVPDLLSRTVPIVDAITPSDETVNPEEFRNSTDPWYRGMFDRLELHPQKYPGWNTRNGLLYKYVQTASDTRDYEKWKLVVPNNFRRAIIRECHNNVTSGHFGVYKTFWRIHQRYYWPRMLLDTKRFIRRCSTCAEQKPEQLRPAGLMGSHPRIYEPWQMISLDFIGPLPRSTQGRTHLLVVSDYLSKFVLLFPVRTANAQTLVKCIEESVFLVYGVPQHIICDNGVQMRSRLFMNLCDRYHVKVRFTPFYHPQADPAERVNRVVKQLISTYIKDNHRHWDVNLASIACAIRTSKHETIGVTPYRANFGKEFRIRGDSFDTDLTDNEPIDVEQRLAQQQQLYTKIVERIRNTHDRNKRTYDLRRRHVTYEIGDQVWRKNKSISDATKDYSAKLAPRFLGPFTIDRKVGYLTYALRDADRKPAGLWHVQDLKPYVEPEDHG